MCTAFSLPGDGLFCRTLDYEHSFGEQPVITPRRFALSFLHLPVLRSHYAAVGMARVQEGYPLYFDGCNEKGLCAAGLNFTKSTVYGEAKENALSLAQFEVTGWLLAACATVAEAAERLHGAVITGERFRPDLPAARLHWLVADGKEALVLESTDSGLQLHAAPTGILTNEPPYPRQLQNLSRYRALTPGEPENRAFPGLLLSPESRGEGASGLPGDFSSPSRFVRAAFVTQNSRREADIDPITHAFRLLHTVSVPGGSCRVGPDAWEITRYAAVMDARRGIYHCTGYGDLHPVTADLRKADPDGSSLTAFPVL